MTIMLYFSDYPLPGGYGSFEEKKEKKLKFRRQFMQSDSLREA